MFLNNHTSGSDITIPNLTISLDASPLSFFYLNIFQTRRKIREKHKYSSFVLCTAFALLSVIFCQISNIWSVYCHWLCEENKQQESIPAALFGQSTGLPAHMGICFSKYFVTVLCSHPEQLRTITQVTPSDSHRHLTKHTGCKYTQTVLFYSVRHVSSFVILLFNICTICVTKLFCSYTLHDVKSQWTSF